MGCKRNILILVLAVTIIFICHGCKTALDRNPIEKDGKLYGVTKGSFLYKWPDYYERALSFSGGQFWLEAEEDLREALLQRDKDQIRARTYGMHYIEYFPHRELGMVLFHQKRYQEAIKELETSLSNEKSAKAEYYLDKARKTLIEQEKTDLYPPEISFESPFGPSFSNKFSATITGVASDDTFVEEILINNKSIRIDLSAPKIPFKMDVPLRLGENSITIEVKDLSGKTAGMVTKVVCDRIGPILNIDELETLESRHGQYSVKGYAYDDSGIRKIAFNGQPYLEESDFDQIADFDQVIELPPGQTKIVVTAEDRAGNITRAELSPPKHPAGQSGDFQDVRLASLDVYPYFLSNLDSNNHDKTRVSEKKDGRYSALDNRGGAVSSTDHRSPVDLPGRNHALIVGINDYEEWAPLKTAVNDARKLKEILVKRYGFQEENVRLLIDKKVTKAALYDVLMQMTSELDETDNLLFYFAGHGQLNEQANDGYWIPMEGKRGRAVWTWIAHSAIKNMIISEEVRAKNIVVIADSCYGGKLLRGGESAEFFSKKVHQSKLLKLSSKKSRQIISSGSLEPVADWGRENHSLFAYYLLKGLEENTQTLVALKSLINTWVYDPVFKISGQRTQIGRFKTPIDEDGEFVLALHSGSPGKPGTNIIESPIDLTPASEKDQYRDSRTSDSIPPVIKIKRWEERQSVFLDKAYLEGNASDNVKVESLTINYKEVLRRSGRNVFFNHLVDLKEGDNLFIIECKDKGGNLTRQEVYIHQKKQRLNTEGSRMSVVMFPFKQSGAQDLNLDDIILGYLVDSDRFFMKDIDRMLIREESVDEDDAKRLALEAGAEFMLKGEVKAETGSLEISARMVEIESSDILTREDVYGEGDVVDRELFQTLCEGLVAKLQSELPLIEGQIASIKGKQIIINRGKNHGLKKGMHLIFFNEGEPILDPESGEVLDEAEVDEIGSARIREVKQKLSYAELLDEEVLKRLNIGHKLIMK